MRRCAHCIGIKSSVLPDLLRARAIFPESIIKAMVGGPINTNPSFARGIREVRRTFIAASALFF